MNILLEPTFKQLEYAPYRDNYLSAFGMFSSSDWYDII